MKESDSETIFSGTPLPLQLLRDGGVVIPRFAIIMIILIVIVNKEGGGQRPTSKTKDGSIENFAGWRRSRPATTPAPCPTGWGWTPSPTLLTSVPVGAMELFQCLPRPLLLLPPRRLWSVISHSQFCALVDNI